MRRKSRLYVPCSAVPFTDAGGPLGSRTQAGVAMKVILGQKSEAGLEVKINAVLLRGMNDRDACASTSAAASTPSC
jgi:hypothetical protein